MTSSMSVASSQAPTRGRPNIWRLLATWDGQSWAQVSFGVSDYVFAMCVFREALYVGGGFISGLPSAYVAAWSGTAWTAVPGQGVPVVSCVANGDALYFGSASSF